MIPEDQVRAALEKVLASDEFAPSARLSRFLRFAVEKTLAGGGADIKEYLLGIEVFDRPDDFDPRIDPIVRVEARRLRSKLEAYYEKDGRDDAVRIVFRKGSYTPQFQLTTTPPAAMADASEPQRPVSLRWILAVAAIAAVSLTALIVGSVADESVLTVLAIPDPGTDDMEFAEGLAEAVCMELAANPELRVVAWPVFAEYRDRRTDLTILEAAQDLNAQAVLVISVRRSQDRRRTMGHLMRADTGQKLWAGEFERSLSEPFTDQRELARVMAQEAGGFLRAPIQ